MDSQASSTNFTRLITAIAAISLIVGGIAGLGPANQAAALDPATALRHE